MKIFWSPLAVERLENIYEHIAIDNNSEAQKMVDKIFKKVGTLSKNPEGGRKVPEANRKEIREVFEGEYRIIYRMNLKKSLFLQSEISSNYYPEKI
jgi:plasmid stabilization system protein ParE